jgi:hypothetical protein
MAYHTFVSGEVLTAANVMNDLMNQSVIVCTSGTRPASPVIGMTVFETDTLAYSTWNGTGWVTALNVGAWTTVTPTLQNQSLGTGGSATGAFTQVGKSVKFRFVFTFGTTPGTPSSSVWVSCGTLPVPKSAAAGACAGMHSGASDFNPANPIAITGRIRIISAALGINLFRSNTGAELSAANANYSPASTEVLAISGEYEAA